MLYIAFLAKSFWFEDRCGHGAYVESDKDAGCLALCLSPFRQGPLLTWSENGGQPASPTINPPVSAFWSAGGPSISGHNSFPVASGTLNLGPEACAVSTVAR